MNIIRILLFLTVSIFISGCLTDGENLSSFESLNGKCTIAGTLILPGSAQSVAASAKTVLQYNSLMKSGAYLPDVTEFVIKCQDQTTRPDESGVWSLSNLEPGDEIIITAENGNIIFESLVSSVKADQVSANKIIDTLSTAESILKSEISARVSSKSLSPLPEDICTLKMALDNALVTGDYRMATLRQLPESISAVEKTITKYQTIDFDNLRPGTIQVSRFSHDFPDANEYDLNSDGFFSKEEFVNFRKYMEILSIADDSNIYEAQNMSASGMGVPVSGIKALSVRSSDFDTDENALIDTDEINSINSFISSMIVRIPAAQNSINDFTNPLVQSSIYYAIPSMYEPDYQENSSDFDSNLGAYISAMTQRRANPGKSFNIGILEPIALKIVSSIPIPKMAAADGTVETSENTDSFFTKSELLLESVSLTNVKNKYPGSVIYDANDDGILKGDEFRLFYNTLPQGMKSEIESKANLNAIIGISLDNIRHFFAEATSLDGDSDGYLDSMTELPLLIEQINSLLKAHIITEE